MAKKWDEIDIDEVLNFNEAHTGKMAQYERIMQHRLTDAVSILSDKLIGVMETIYRAHQGLKGKADDLQTAYEEISKKQMDSYKQISDSQSRLQKWIIVLTFIIAISTVAYVFITWKSVSAIQESNVIQRKTVEAMQEANRIQNVSLKLNAELLNLEQSKRKKNFTEALESPQK